MLFEKYENKQMYELVSLWLKRGSGFKSRSGDKIEKMVKGDIFCWISMLYNIYLNKRLTMVAI